MNLRLFIWWFFLPVILHAQQEHYIIATGSRGGNYYKFGDYIAKRYNAAFPAKFGIIETNGSNENIELLRNNEVDLALVQRNVLLSSLYNDEKGIKNIEVILPLYEEKLWIYHRGPGDTEARQMAAGATKKRIGFTSKNSYSYKTFRTLARFLNLPKDRFEEEFDNYDTLIDRFKKGKLDYVVSFSLPLKEMDSLKAKVVYLTPEDAEMLQNHIRNVNLSSLGKGRYTLGSWSFITGRKNILQKLRPGNSLIHALISPPPDSSLHTFRQTLSKSFERFRDDPALRAEQLKNLPLHKSLRRAFRMPVWDGWIYAVLALIVAALLLWHYFYTGKWFPKYNLLYFWNRYKHFQLGFIVLIIIYFGSIETMIWAERRFYENIGIKSQILNMTRPDLHSWLFVTTVTGNSNGIFPLSTLGKMMLSLNSLNFWIGTILIGVSEYATYKMSRKRKKGLMKTHFKNHLVIFGWNGTTEKFIQGILKDAKEYHNKDMRIVCVAENIPQIRDKHPAIKDLHDNKVIDLIEGDARDVHVLEKAGVARADTIVLLAEDNSFHADERTLLRALAVSRFVNNHPELREEEPSLPKRIINKVFPQKKNRNDEDEKQKDFKPMDKIYMIAEINHPEIRENLFEADVNEIVVAGNYRKAIMKQAIFNHGLSKVFDEILEYNDLNEFYKIDLAEPENAHLRGKTFDELLPLLRKENILLIGYHIIFFDENGKILIDKKKIQEKLAKREGGITRDVIINPKDERERTRRVDDNDHLIVLAYNAKELREGVRNLRKEMSKSGDSV